MARKPWPSAAGSWTHTHAARGECAESGVKRPNARERAAKPMKCSGRHSPVRDMMVPATMAKGMRKALQGRRSIPDVSGDLRCTPWK